MNYVPIVCLLYTSHVIIKTLSGSTQRITYARRFDEEKGLMENITIEGARCTFPDSGNPVLEFLYISRCGQAWDIGCLLYTSRCV